MSLNSNQLLKQVVKNYHTLNAIDFDDSRPLNSNQLLSLIVAQQEQLIASGGVGGTGESSYPAPYIQSINPSKILTSNTTKITIVGSFFTPDLSVEISHGSVETTEFISSNRIIVTVAASNTEESVDLTLDNGIQTMFEAAFSTFAVPAGLVDLRLGGTEFSNFEIEMRAGMSFERRADGLIFTGSSPWTSWARFVGDDDKWVWNRSVKKTLTWIYRNSGNCMLGIGSRANVFNSGSQWQFGECLSYQVSGSRIGNLFGNDGTPGNYQSQTFSASKSSSNDFMKIVFTQNGENGGIFQVYNLPSGEIADWFDTSQLLAEIIIAGLGSDEPQIMPFVIPQDGDASIFLGFIIEDE